MEDQQIKALLEKYKRLQHEAFIRNFNIDLEEWARWEIYNHANKIAWLIASVNSVCEVAIQSVKTVRGERNE